MAVMSSAYESAGELARELTGGQKFMKYVIIGLAGLYLIFGIVLCATGSAALAGYAASIAGTTLPKGLIVVGAFLIFTSLVGGLSAWYEFRIGLGFYFGSMLLWTIILLAIGIAVLAVKSNLTTYLASGWALADCGTQQTIQQSFSCCGRYMQTDSYVFGATGYNSNPDAIWGFNGIGTGQGPNPATWQYATFPTLNCNGQAGDRLPGALPGPIAQRVAGPLLVLADDAESGHQLQLVGAGLRAGAAEQSVGLLADRRRRGHRLRGDHGHRPRIHVLPHAGHTDQRSPHTAPRTRIRTSGHDQSACCSPVLTPSLRPLPLPLCCDCAWLRHQRGDREEPTEDTAGHRVQASEGKRRVEDPRHRALTAPSHPRPLLRPPLPPPASFTARPSLRSSPVFGSARCPLPRRSSSHPVCRCARLRPVAVTAWACVRLFLPVHRLAALIADR